MPQSLRGRYPLTALNQKPAAGNKASVVAPPARKADGFDRKTSRELAGGRQAHERLFQNADGTQTTELSAEPLNYRGPDGSWTPIDSSLTSRDGGGWRNTADATSLALAARADAADLVTMTLDAQHSLAYGLSGAAAVTGRAQGDAIVYPGVLPSVDLKLESLPQTLKETLVLRSAKAPATFTFPLRLTGLTAKLDGRSVVLSDAAGVQRAVIPPGFMVDSAATPVRSDNVTYRLEGNTLRVTADPAWLRDPARKFPVLLDPTVGPPVKTAAPSSMMTVKTSGSDKDPDTLLVGRVGTDSTASYLKYNLDALANNTIYGVALTAVNYDAPSCRARQVTVHPVTESWTASGDYRYPGPSVGSAIAKPSFAYGFIPFGASASPCPMASEMINLGQSGVDLVQRWVNGQQANNGLSLRASVSDSSAWKKIGGVGQNSPKLYVTHSPYNAGYAIPKPLPEPAVLRNQDGVVKVTVTNKGAEAWTPGNYYLAYRAYKANTGESAGQQRAANLTTTVARGGKVTLDATIKRMEPGTYYLDFTMVRTGGAVFTDHQVPPGRIVLQVFDVPPVVQEIYPPNGYQAQTLTPLLWAKGVDTDAPPGSALQYKFEICDRPATGDPTGCTNSGYQTKPSWVVPSGRMVWSKEFIWRAYVKDGASEVKSPDLALMAAVPQPEITSRIANAPYASQSTEYDAQNGNYRTAALDAPVATVGPELNMTRTYNSLDPRTDSAFGAGWSSRYDMKIVPDDDGSGNVVITYPDGQAVRFGKNADGTFAAPQGRTAKLTVDSTGWTLLDKGGTKFLFGLAGAGLPSYLTRITGVASRSVLFSYGSTGKVSKVQVSNSQTNTAGRSLKFTWAGNHIETVTTDAVNGAALTWKYTYAGDKLTQVCRPPATTGCTVYEYSDGSHYRSAVLDSRPESYWRLGEKDPTGAASEIAVNLGKDAGTHKSTTVGTPGAIAGNTDTATSFNGTSSYIELPKGTVKKSRDAAVEAWFKVSGTQTGGPIIGYQDKAVGTAATAGVPVLYTDTDGYLRGQFADGTVNALKSDVQVWNDTWHHAVLSVSGTTQTLWLDGRKVAERAGTIEHSTLTFNQIGAASLTNSTTTSKWGTTAQRFFQGSIDEVAVYNHPLGMSAVKAHHKAGIATSPQISKVTLPSGRIGAEVTYDTAIDRIKQYTDDNGGTFKIGAPLVYGNDRDLRRSVQVLDPANRPLLFEYDALAGRLLRTGTPLGLEIRDEDTGIPEPGPDPDPVPTCPQPDPQDPAFCTTIPDTAGGPVFVRHTLDGLAVRSFEYDDKGNQKKVVNENGDAVEMKYDDRGNVTERITCRVSGQCFTAYSTYPASPTDQYDPRSDLVTATRDGRSTSATDTDFRTTYSYHFTGQLDVQTNPDGSVVDHEYSNGTELAAGGGQIPTGLVTSTKDARGKITRYAYFQNGDLAKVTTPPPIGQTTGLVTDFTYDAIGRKLTEKVTSDAYPSGLTTTFAYNTDSRVSSVTRPATTDAVTGVRHQQQVVNEYDADGNMTKVTISDLLGGDTARSTSTEYDDYGNAVRAIDPEGGETTYAYDRFGNKVSEVDACGNRYDYAYTATNKQAEVRARNWRADPDGAPATGTGDYLVLHSYSYDYAGRLASDTDAMGRRLEYTYYADDLLRKVVMKNYRDPITGATREYVIEENTYNGAGHLTRKVEGNGTQVTTYTVDKAGKVTASAEDPDGLNRVNTTAFDLNGNVLRTTATGKFSNVPGLITQPTDQVSYEYDDAGNMTKQTVTAGTDTRTTSYTYDRRGLRKTQTDPRGDTTDYDYDEAGQLVKVTGPAVTVDNADGTTTTARPVAVTGYDTFGAPTSVRDPRGQLSRSVYDKLGRAVQSIAPSYVPPGETAAITPATSTTYDANGNVATVTSPRGAISRFTYDQLNRLVTRDDPGATNDERAKSSFTYTRNGQLLSTTGPTGARTESTYDDLERPTTSTTIERFPQAGVFTSKIAYDDAGNARSITTPSGASSVNVFDNLGQLIKTTSPNGVVEQFGYDYTGRKVREVDGAGRVTRRAFNQFGDQTSESDLKPGTEEVLRTQSFGYDKNGNMVSATDPDTRVSTYEWDAGGRLTKQIEPVSADRNITTTFGYDAAGHRTRYTDGRGNATRYTYNSLGLSESVIEPSTSAHPAAADRTWTVGYNGDADPVRLSAPGGVVRTRDYDISGRLRTETGAGAAVATTDRTIGYDLANRVTAISAPGGTNSYTYNDRGALLTAAGPGGSATFTYDNDGQLTGRADAAGTATFSYDKGRLKTMQDGLTGTTQTLGYDPAGAVKTVDFGGGRVRTYEYDDFGRLSADTLRNAGSAVVASVAYGYDRNGHVTRKTTTGTADAGDNTYEYDWAGRLTAWTGSKGRVAYEWDDSGNRTKAGDKTSTYDERNRLLSDGDYTYTYTPRGTLTGRTSSGHTEQYSFDAFDRLVSSEGQTYTYDGLDRAATRNGIAFTYAGMGGDSVAFGSERYGRGPDGDLLATQVGTVKRLALSDGHGDIVAEIDPTDTTATKPAGSTAYDPFGQKTATESRTSSLGYQGDFTDPDTDQVNMGARWYQPGTGGFNSRDSANYGSGPSILANRYSYGAGAPLDFDDPDGHWPKWVRKAAGAIANVAVNTVKTFVTNTWTGMQLAWSGLKRLGSAMWAGTKWLYHKSGLSNVVKNVVNAGKAAINWGKQQAAAIAERAYQAKVAVRAAAQKAVAKAVKYSQLPVALALAKPLLSGLGKIVSTSAKLAASVVSLSVMAINDPGKFQTTLYLQATQKLGAVIESVSKAAQAAGEFIAEHKDVILEGLAIAGAVAAGLACTAATAGAAALACIAGSAALINLAKDAGQGNIKGWKDALKSAAIGGVTGLIGGGAGMIGARVAANFGGRGIAALGGRVLAGAAEGGVSDAATQLVTTGRVDASGVAMAAAFGGVTGGRRVKCGGNSFTPGTRVLMADDSEKPIEEVEVGDTVTATDPTTGETEDREVTDLIVGEGEKNLVEITIDVDGDAGDRTAKITATDGHPFWVDNLNRWIDAEDLKPGYQFESADHGPAEVSATRTWTQQAQVYNLTVDVLHTYYVLADEVPTLVHNCDGEVSWVDENASKSAAAADYEAGAIGGGGPKVPALDYVNGNLDIAEVRFDGFDAAAGVFIDRKHGVATTKKMVDAAVRQSMALEQNGYTGRWEVPNNRAFRRATKVFKDANVTNITPVVVRHALPGCSCSR